MCSVALSKIFLVIFNAIFFILGAVCLAIGIFILLDKDYLIENLSRIPDAGESLADAADDLSIIESASIVLIVAGLVIFIFGFCGCCGAIRENKCLLQMYFVFLLLTIILEVGAVVAVVFYRDEVDDHLTTFLLELLQDDYEGVTFDNSGEFVEAVDALTAAFDISQVLFECCGVDNYTDYDMATAWNSTYSINRNGVQFTGVALVPPTCCKMVDSGKFPGSMDEIEFLDLETCMLTANASTTNKIGCYDAIHDKLDEYSKIAMGIAAGIALIELIGIIAACSVIKAIEKKDQGGTK